MRVLPVAVVVVLAAACANPPAEDAESTVTVPSPTAEPGATSEAAPAPASPSATEVELFTSDVATGLEAPWAVAFAPDGTAYISERDRGRVLRLESSGSLEEVASFEIDPTSEAGLLGLALSPEHASDGLFYVYFTAAQDNRVVRFGLGEPAAVVLDGIPKAGIHNGGRIAFGPDGKLYVATGDAGEGDRAQDPESLAGKILRLEPDGTVPDDNPDPGSPVYSLGHRNVQGLAWDAGGRLYASEFGPDADDELNRIEPGGNYGWPQVTGMADLDGFIDPVVVRQPPEASWSGMTILDGSAIPQWEGDALIASLRGERLWRVPLGSGGEVEELLRGEYGRLRLATQAPDGSVWLLTNNTDSRGAPRAGDDRIVRLGPMP